VNAPIYQQFHTAPSTLPAGSPTGPQPVQRSASSGLDSAEYSGEERWEYLAAQEQRAPTELPEPPRMLAPGHSHSHSQSQPASDMHPPRPESPYSVASSYTPSVQPHGAPPSSRKVKKPPPPAASAVTTTLGLLNALAPQAAPQPSPPSMAHQQSWVDEGPDPHSHQEERRDKRPGFWSRDTDRNKERDKGKSRDANDPADLIRMIGESSSWFSYDYLTNLRFQGILSRRTRRIGLSCWKCASEQILTRTIVRRRRGR
jgi:hypothetical protein